ncbi:MAG: alpha/beta fold hydrolase [Actinomycetota bacterium]
MIESPIFVPFEGERLAAIVTIPESTPRALVLMLQGLGATRSHRYGLWARTARSLAERGLASVRMDYPELGDSTGSFPSNMNDPPVKEATAVAGVALDSLGLDAMGIVGNCLGAKTGLAMAARMESCVSVGCNLPSSPKSLLRGAGRTAPHRAARRAGKRFPRIARGVRRVVPTHRIKPRLRFIPEVPEALASTDVLFLYLGQEEASRRFGEAVDGLVADGGSGSSRRAEVRLIPAGNTSGMLLDLKLQPIVIEHLVGWMDETLPAAAKHPAGDGGLPKVPVPGTVERLQ